MVLSVQETVDALQNLVGIQRLRRLWLLVLREVNSVGLVDRFELVGVLLVLLRALNGEHLA